MFGDSVNDVVSQLLVLFNLLHLFHSSSILCAYLSALILYACSGLNQLGFGSDSCLSLPISQCTFSLFVKQLAN